VGILRYYAEQEKKSKQKREEREQELLAMDGLTWRLMQLNTSSEPSSSSPFQQKVGPFSISTATTTTTTKEATDNETSSNTAIIKELLNGLGKVSLGGGGKDEEDKDTSKRMEMMRQMEEVVGLLARSQL
jgi:hypothetical protein